MQNVNTKGHKLYEYQQHTRGGENLGYAAVIFSCKERQKAVEIINEN